MRKLIALFVLICLVIGGWYIASPWLAMQGIVDAAEAGDANALDERIDFEQLQSNANSQIADAINERIDGDSALQRIGGRIAGGIAERVVNNALTPQGMVNLVTAGSVAMPLVPERFRGQELEWDVSREGFDQFRGVSTWEDGSAGPVMLFERAGLGWELVGVRLAR